MKRAACIAAIAVLSSCAESTHVAQRRDEVRRYFATLPPLPAVGVDEGDLGQWRWGMTHDEVLAITPYAWSDGDDLQASVLLGDSRGLAVFTFKADHLRSVSVLLRNQPRAAHNLAAAFEQVLLSGPLPSPASADAIVETVANVARVEATVDGRHAVLLGSHLDVWEWFHQVSAGAETLSSMRWQTTTTRATVTLASASMSLVAESRSPN